MLGKIVSAVLLALDSSLFIIRIENGRAQPLKGRVPRGFLSDLNEAVAEMHLQNGVIKARRQATHIRINFSKDIPAGLHQRLRNIWHIHELGFRE